MRILVITTPFTGHITPTFSMVKSLVNMGHSVDYLTTSQWESTIQKTGAGLIPYENDRKLSVMIKDAYKAAQSIGSYYDVIVYDELFFPGKILGEGLDLPAVRFFPCVAINEQIMEQMLHGRGFMGIFRFSFIRKRWTKEICRTLVPSIIDWTEEVVNNSPDCNIVFVPDWFQPHLSEFPADKYHFVGPSIYDDSDMDVPDWLESKQQPVIYVSLGTIDNSQIRFYKKCFQVFADKDARFIVSVGNRIPIKKLGEIPPNCTVYPYAPQKKILAYSDLFITHGGMNSINEAMVNGVPMLLLPLSNDQPINARRVEELGMGKRLEMQKLNEVILWDSISDMLHNQKIKASVSLVQEKLSKSSGGETAARILTSSWMI